MRHALFIPLALIAAPASPQGFTASDLDNAARAASPDVEQTGAARRIAARTEILRAIVAVNMASATRRISDEELQILTKAVGAPTPTRDVILSWLMRSGLTTAADGEISGIYSPLSDSWLVLRWAQLGGTPRLIDAALVGGTTLRPVDTQPDWRDSEAPFALALLAAKLQAMDSFAALPRALGASRLFALLDAMREPERAAVFARSGAMLGSMSAWSRSNRQAIAAVDRQARKGSDPAVLALPRTIRDALTPMAVLTSPQGTLLVLQSPVYPAKTIAARFPEPGAVAELSLIDLSPTSLGSAAR